MIRLQLTTDSQQRMDEVFDKLGNVAEDIKDDVFEIVYGVFARTVESIFDVEGEPAPWKPLAISTMMERAQLGYGTGPILYRTGKLKESLTNPRMGPQLVEVKTLSGSMTVQGGNQLWEFQTGQASFTYWLENIDERFEQLNAIRPMVPTDQMFDDAMKDHEAELIALVEKRF